MYECRTFKQKLERNIQSIQAVMQPMILQLRQVLFQIQSEK